MVARIIHDLDRTLHEKSRLAIATALSEHEKLTFIQLRELLEMTDGNLCIHVRTLEGKGYLEKKKRTKNGKAFTECWLSDRGKRALLSYVDNMEQLIRSVKSTS